MPGRNRQSGTNVKPELERDFQRHAELGYEPEGRFGCIRYLEHGTPNPLIRWHYHEEYELHLIVNTRGKVFVGDYIGEFKPGNLILTGPRLPHNWISSEGIQSRETIRDRVLQFSDDAIREASHWLPEFKDVFQILDQARNGIEFVGISDYAEKKMTLIQQTSGLPRLIEFLKLLDRLAKHRNFNLLSSVQLQSNDDDASLAQISEVIDYINENYSTSITLSEVAARLSMSESNFSRYFRKTTGNKFTDFVNRVRINRACQLLLESEQYINDICFSVGYNSLANFNRRFLEIKGLSPRDYRRSGKERFG